MLSDIIANISDLLIFNSLQMYVPIIDFKVSNIGYNVNCSELS